MSGTPVGPLNGLLKDLSCSGSITIYCLLLPAHSSAGPRYVQGFPVMLQSLHSGSNNKTSLSSGRPVKILSGKMWLCYVTPVNMPVKRSLACRKAATGHPKADQVSASFSAHCTVNIASAGQAAAFSTIFRQTPTELTAGEAEEGSQFWQEEYSHDGQSDYSGGLSEEPSAAHWAEDKPSQLLHK